MAGKRRGFAPRLDTGAPRSEPVRSARGRAADPAPCEHRL